MEYNAEKVMMGLHSCTRGRKSNDDRPCFECPYEECNIVGGTSERQTKGTCQGWLKKDALALLREKDAEIERLTRICDSYALQYGTATDREAILKETRTETAQKMQSMITKRCIKAGIYPVIVARAVDEAVKEVVEDV